MKRVLKLLFVIPVLILLFLSISVDAQPIASGKAGRHAESRPPVNGGTAPIGSGLLLLLTMAAGYGVRKIFDARNSLDEEVSSQ